MTPRTLSFMYILNIASDSTLSAEEFNPRFVLDSYSKSSRKITNLDCVRPTNLEKLKIFS